MVNIFDFIMYGFNVGFINAVEGFEWIALEDRDIFTILFFFTILAAFCCVVFWRFIRSKENLNSIVSIINKKHN